MNKSRKVFDNVITFEDFKSKIEQNIKYLITGVFDLESLSLAMNGLATIPDENKRQVLRFISHVDRKLSHPGAAEGNSFQKIPAMMSGFIYLRYFPEQIKDLTLDELTVLSVFSVVEPPSFYENAVDYLGKELLSATTQKTDYYRYQSMFLDYGESKIREGETKEAAAAYIKQTPLETLIQEVVEWEREELQKDAEIYL